ncbi:MAG: prepilin-type N-terminal cleavage/methylation domain-containing protein [Pseudomonadota bacterium]
MNKNISFKKSQSGFTLVEIAIVLVIIGLLLGGVLKGTELIESAKVKRGVNEINGVIAALYAYQDRYQRLPGDDGPIATLTARGGAWSTVTLAGAPANGALLVTLAQTFTAAGEHWAFWQHLRAAGFVTGNPAAAAVDTLPRNAFGGLIGITTAGVGGPATNQITGRIVCSSQVPGKSAQALDTQMDDGNGSTGRMRATIGAAGTNTIPVAAVLAIPYSEASIYTLCVQM